jgi:hypothetical protein
MRSVITILLAVGLSGQASAAQAVDQRAAQLTPIPLPLAVRPQSRSAGAPVVDDSGGSLRRRAALTAPISGAAVGAARCGGGRGECRLHGADVFLGGVVGGAAGIAASCAGRTCSVQRVYLSSIAGGVVGVVLARAWRCAHAQRASEPRP